MGLSYGRDIGLFPKLHVIELNFLFRLDVEDSDITYQTVRQREKICEKGHIKKGII